MAPVGQAAAQQPQLSQSVARQSGPKGASMAVRRPRLAVASVWLRAWLLQVPTQRWQPMHSRALKRRNGLSSKTGAFFSGAGKLGASTPSARQRSCSSQSPFFRQLKQKFVEFSPWLEMTRSSARRRAASTRGVSVRTTMPSRTGVLQAGTRSGSPSTSTTHTRHEPTALTSFR